MNRKVVFLFLIALFTYVNGQYSDDDDYYGSNSGSYGGGRGGSYSGYISSNYSGSGKYYSSADKYGYGSNNDGYYDNNYDMSSDRGIDDRKYGQDFADFKPIYNKRPTMLEALDIWISSADDWESNSKSKYRGRGRGNYGKYSKDNKDNDYKNDGYRKKRSYSRVRFPVRHYPEIRKFPIRRFPPLISIFPWLPIFYDKITYQTFIFSPTGGIYILPPLINFYGQRFAVAQLIKWGYASLVSSGAPPPPNVNVAPLIQPPPPGGPVTAGVVGSAGAGPAPGYDEKNVRFSGGVKTDFPAFKPRYPQDIQEEGSYQSDRSYRNYGGTGQQQVYAQGG